MRYGKPTTFHLFRKDGSAMILTLLVMAVLTGLGTIVVAVGSSNLQNSARDRFTGIADTTAQAGIAQAIEFIRTNGVNTLACDVPATSGTVCSNDWGRDNPHIVSLAPDRFYSTWIERVERMQFPTAKVGTYRIHSTGSFGSGRGLRVLNQIVTIQPGRFPLGIYSANNIVAAGTPTVEGESIYTRGCVFDRDAINLGGTDIITGLPAGVHSTQYITTRNNGACSSSDGLNIHKPAPGPGFCNATFPNDRDALGGPTADTACNPPLANTFFDEAGLEALGLGLPRGLTDAQYAHLKSKATEQGYFSTEGGNSCGGNSKPPGCWLKPDGDTYPNAVLYFKVPPGTKITIQGSDVSEYGLSTCGSRSLIIIVDGGDIQVTSNLELVGAIFVPDGTYQAAGTTDIDGTLFAKVIDKLTGDHTFHFESCWLDNFPGGLLDINLGRFAERDR